MRDVLPEWYAPDGEELRALYTTATVVVDANVVLSLYRVGAEQRDELLAVLRKVADRLWVPYQVAEEFQRNRLRVVHQQEGAHQRVRDALRRGFEDARKQLDGERDKALAEAIGDLLATKLQAMEQDLVEVQRAHVVSVDDVLATDEVRAALDELLAGRVGKRPSADVRKQREAEAKQRAEQRIPPGYADAGKSGDRPWGDFLLWAEVLDHAKETKCDVLLITDDRKEDWFLSVGGRTVGPRPELVAEVREHAGVRYHQQTLRRFLELAGDLLDTPVTPETIDEATDVAPVREGGHTRPIAVPAVDLTALDRAMAAYAAVDPGAVADALRRYEQSYSVIARDLDRLQRLGLWGTTLPRPRVEPEPGPGEDGDEGAEGCHD